MLSHLVEKRILGFDWDEREVRVVHASIRKQRCHVLSVQSFAIPQDVNPGDSESFGRLIREFLDRERITTRHAVVDVPRDQATVKLLKGLPPARPEDLPGVIAMQFERELPFPASQASIDYAGPVTDPKRGTQTALAAAVREEVLNDYVAIFRAAGLKLEHVGLRPNANRIAVNAVVDPGRHERVLFVDVGPAFTEIDVICDGHLVFTRAASVHVPKEIPSEPPPEAAEPSTLDLDQPVRLSAALGSGVGERSGVVNALVVEVVRSIEAFRSDDPEAPPSHVVIGGGTGVEEALADALHDRLDMTTELFNPALHLGWDAERGAAAGGFAAALGLVLGRVAAGEARLDFMHPKRVVTATEQQLKKLPLVGAAAAVVLIGLGVAYWTLVVPQQRILDQYDEQIAAAQENRRDMENLRKLIKNVEQTEADQIVWLDELYDALSCLPGDDQLVLRSIEMRQKDRYIGLAARADSRETLTDAVDDLQVFRVPGVKRQHFQARLRTTRTVADRYPADGKIDVTVVGRRARPDLGEPSGDETDRNHRGG
ncbi:MAG: pilus assembly protein PilM [Phycisphaerales bacterium]|nr:MAG: pilus assembly protein PilM [Phycisphaerales bacterium]